VTIRVYDADNHLFCPGTSPPKPSEYEPSQHVDPAVVAEVASWLMDTGKVRTRQAVRLMARGSTFNGAAAGEPAEDR
jgi:hypothetical protein